MEIAVVVLIALAGLVSLVGSVLFLVVAFRESPWWGLAVLLLPPFANIAFLIACWDEARKPFLVQVLGMLLFVGGVGLAVSTGVKRMSELQAVGGIDLPAHGVSFLPGELEGGDGLSGESWEDAEVRVEGDFVGMTLEEVRERLGKPRAEMTVGGETTYFYPGLELYSEDGVRVTGQGVPVENR